MKRRRLRPAGGRRAEVACERRDRGRWRGEANCGVNAATLTLVMIVAINGARSGQPTGDLLIDEARGLLAKIRAHASRASGVSSAPDKPFPQR